MSERSTKDAGERDGRLARLIEEHYAPPPLAASERARLRARVEERAAARRPLRRWLPALALAPLLALALLVLRGEPAPPAGAPDDTSAWTSELLYPPEVVGDDASSDDPDALPDEYVAIEMLLAGV